MHREHRNHEDNRGDESKITMLTQLAQTLQAPFCLKGLFIFKNCSKFSKTQTLR